jgi:hypothetical protein
MGIERTKTQLKEAVERRDGEIDFALRLITDAVRTESFGCLGQNLATYGATIAEAVKEVEVLRDVIQRAEFEAEFEARLNS